MERHARLTGQPGILKGRALTDQATETAAQTAVSLPARTGTALAELRTIYNPDLDFRKLAAETRLYTEGFRLITADDKYAKDMLIGVPHIVVGLTFRDGYTDGKIQGDYVSVEAVIADKGTMEAPQVRHQLPSPLLVYPNEAVVYNDGGTGIRRELV